MNKYSGGNFDDFLKEEGIFEEVVEYTRKRLLISQLGCIVKILIQQETTSVEEIKPEPIEDIWDFRDYKIRFKWQNRWAFCYTYLSC